jgi:hypothetical protein
MWRKQDMPREKVIEVKDYIRYWSDGTKDGHEIRIAHGDFYKPKLLKLKLKWPDRTRDKEGRVTTYYGRK